MDQLSRYHKHRQILIQELGGQCVQCGNTERLEFDHIDPKTKTLEISKSFNLSLNKLREETKKCQLLCKICHKSKSDNERCIKLCKEDIPVIKSLLKLGFTQTEIAQRFNISQKHVSDIKLNKRWNTG